MLVASGEHDGSARAAGHFAACRPLGRWLVAALLISACAEAPAGTEFFESNDSAVQGPVDMDSGVANPDPTGGGGLDGPESGLPSFPLPDASSPPAMMDASRPPATQDAGRDTGVTLPPPMMDAARPPPTPDAATPDVSAPSPDASMPPPTGDTCSSTPAYATPDACSKCICMRCAAQVSACYASNEPAKNTACKSVRDCAQTNHCTSESCYCGSSPTCLFPDGPCMDVIHTAAGATDALGVSAARDDPANPVYRSNQVGTCEMANCASECGL